MKNKETKIPTSGAAMYNVQEENVHPEMLNAQGQWINEELLSVRFLNEDELEEE